MTSTNPTASGTAPATPPAAAATPSPKSVLSGVLTIVKQDAGAALVGLLQTFQTSVDASPSIEGAVAAGDKFAADAVLSAPELGGTLIKDLTNLLVGDAISALAPSTTSNAGG
jgi:hypothetical protein